MALNARSRTFCVAISASEGSIRVGVLRCSRLTFNDLVDHNAEVPTVLDQPSSETFRALGDPVRCTIVEYLGDHGDTNVNELAALFPISLQAVSKHIKVLQAAGVVSQHREGRHRPVTLEESVLAEALDWLEGRQRQLEARYERLDEVLADLQRKTRP